MKSFRAGIGRRTEAYYRSLGLRPPLERPPSVHLGTNLLSGREIHVPLEEFTKTHTLSLGRSGTGKTKQLEGLCRAFLPMVRDQGWSLVVLDGKGGTLQTLADDLFAACVAEKLTPDRTTYFNPHGSERVPGFNFCDLIGETTAATQAEKIVENLELMFGEDDEYRPWWSEHSKGALIPLVRAGFTIMELLPFLSLDKPGFREAVLQAAGDPAIASMWAEFEASFKTPEQAKILNVVRTRAKEFWYNPLFAALFGQRKTTIDWVRLMDEGGVFLGKLGSGPKFSETAADFTGRGIMHQIIQAAEARNHHNRKPCIVVVDEFERFASKDFERALELLRGYGVSLVLSCQQFEQLRDRSERLRASAMLNCRIKLFFSLSRADSEEAALEIFSGTFGKDEIIETITQPAFRPVETTRTVETESSMYSETDSSGDTSVDTTGVSEGSSENETGDVVVQVHGSSSGKSSGETHSHGSTYAYSSSRSRVPWHSYEEYEVIAQKRTWTVEQLREQAIAAISEQGDRKYQLRLFDRPPLPMRTPEVSPPKISPLRVTKALEVNYNTFRAITEVVVEVNERVADYLTSLPQTESDESKTPKHSRGRPTRFRPDQT